MKRKSSEYRLLSGLFFRLLPYQVLLIVISSLNGIVDSIYASNFIGDAVEAAVKAAETERLYKAWIERLRAETYIRVF